MSGAATGRPRSRGRRRRPAWGAAALALALAAVGGGCHPAGDPVARLEVAPSVLRLGYPEVQPLHLVWQPLTALPPPERADAGEEGPVVFVHLLDADERTARTFDHPFPDDWQPGAPVEYDLEIYQSALAPALPAGSYTLTVGLYRPGGPRWPLEVAARDRGRLEYVVGRVEVPDPGAAVPRFDFVGEWAPVRPGTDIQVLATRWLQGSGAIAVSGLPGAGRVILALDLPAAGDPATLLVLGADAQTPNVVVTSSCSDTEVSVSGGGRHWVEVPVSAEAAGGAAAGCEVRLAPNFYLVTTGTPVRRVALLEVLSWSVGPAAGGAEGEEAP